MSLSELIGRSSNCPSKCGEGAPVDDADECFAHDQNADYIQAVEPDCDVWKNGWKCRAADFLGNVTWLFNKITCAIKNLNDRLSALEAENPLVDIEFIDNDGDGFYDTIIEHYRDGSTEAQPYTDKDTNLSVVQTSPTTWDILNPDGSVQETITDTDTDVRLSNPHQCDPDGDGNIQICWDLIDVETGAVVQANAAVEPYIPIYIPGVYFKNQNIPIFSEDVVADANPNMDGAVDIINTHQFDVANLVGVPAGARIIGVSFFADASARTSQASANDISATISCNNGTGMMLRVVVSDPPEVRRNRNNNTNDRLIEITGDGIYHFTSRHVYLEAGLNNSGAGDTHCAMRVKGVFYEL